MFCAISGTTPEEPVISSRTGHLFEKNLIVKALQETGECPITKQALSPDDLLEIKANKAVKPRPAASASIPGLLSTFHNEWDALMLETHALRDDLHKTRQELSHALYQHDAACRVIARLIKERDEARAALAGAQAGKRPAAAAMDVDMDGAKKAKGGISPEIVDAMTARSQVLSKGRKKRVIAESLRTADDIAAYACKATVGVHKTSPGGVNAICELGGLVATAGNDSTVAVFDTSAGKRIQALSGHSKKVLDTTFVPGEGGEAFAVISSSADKTVKLWSAGNAGAGSGGLKCAATLAEHSAEVTGLTVHATNSYFVSVSADKSWCFYDIAAAECVQKVADEAVEAGYTCGQFHPDGLILGTGTADASVRIWDIKAQKSVAKVEGHTGAVAGLSFSENGYYLATAAADGVKLWDLRKLKNFKSLSAPGGGGKSGATAVAFDFSGHYLAAAGGSVVDVYNVKADWGVVKEFEVPKKSANAVAFAPDAAGLYVGANDHNLRVFA